MGTFKSQARRLWDVLLALGRLPEYDAEANRLYRDLRRQHARHEQAQPVAELSPRESRGRRKVAIAGAAGLIVAWYLFAASTASAAVRLIPVGR